MRKRLILLSALAMTILIFCVTAEEQQSWEKFRLQEENYRPEKAKPPEGYDFDPSTLKPLTGCVPYVGKYETGLYPGGTNEMPVAHRKAGERLAATIRPLDVNGKPDEVNG